MASRLLAEGLHMRQRFPYKLGTSSCFNLTRHKKGRFHNLTQNIMTLNLTFSPANQNILAWATLHFAILHHCISSVLSCNQNTHCAQGPKSDYTHAYNHSLSNLLSCQSPFWSSSVFSMLHFLSFIPIQSPLANRRHTIGTFTKIVAP